MSRGQMQKGWGKRRRKTREESPRGDIVGRSFRKRVRRYLFIVKIGIVSLFIHGLSYAHLLER